MYVRRSAERAMVAVLLRSWVQFLRLPNFFKWTCYSKKLFGVKGKEWMKNTIKITALIALLGIV